MHPRTMAPNLIEHFYRGGDRIAALRGIVQTSEFQPEEWLAATVTRDGETSSGLARTTDGELLRDLVQADPAAWIGEHHGDAWRPGDTGLLVKLLDARQRLPVHVHPERAFSRSHLDCPYGKTEAWFVLDAEPGSAFHLGWSEPVDADELDRRRDAQDSEWMLSRMNRIEARRGMGVLVPAGTVHAIDAGVFVAEVQEPTDFSVLLEWSVTTVSRDQSHLGLGFETVMRSVSKDPTTGLDALIHRADLDIPASGVSRLLPARADAYFRLDRVGPHAGGASSPDAGPEPDGAGVDAGFAILLALADSAIRSAHGETLDIPRGDVVALPAAFGTWTAQEGDLLVHRPGVGWPQSLAESTVV